MAMDNGRGYGDGDTDPQRPSLMTVGVANRVRQLEDRVDALDRVISVFALVMVMMIIALAHVWMSLPPLPMGPHK